MAFYQNAPHQQRKVSHAKMGSWDDEGTHYRRGGSLPRHSDAEFPQPRQISWRRKRRSDPSFQAGERRDTAPVRPPRQECQAPVPRREAMSHDEHRPAHPAPPMSYRNFEQPHPASSARPVPNPMLREEALPENLLYGRNPIREALKAGRSIEKLLVQRGDLSGSARKIIQMAREARIPIQEVDKARLDELCPHHQGLLAHASAYPYASVEDMLDTAQERGEEPFLILLDGITDPHNLGAIIRTAEAVGAHGVIVPERRSVGLTPAAVKASAGSVEHLKVARVVNLTRTLEMLKERGIWIYAVTMEGEIYDQVDFSGGVALVIGAEGDGISRLALETCDKSVSLPMKGALDSLNASVAASVVMYRVMQARRNLP